MKNLFPDIPWRVVCPDVRAYTTHYAFEDCIGLLCRKNVYDTFEYTFFWKNGYFIRFDEPQIPRTLDMRFCKGSVFSMEFESYTGSGKRRRLYQPDAPRSVFRCEAGGKTLLAEILRQRRGEVRFAIDIIRGGFADLLCA